ncbi:hypothetical protein CPB84DRAFT_546328 [Gymnopilus junonius]|uniref:Uncharacterized protein n=1 Tax=Gymnopilus junonius TaxID=109634 RepID=A0A9P5NTG9_GYMJU|nr:hypothetical protein CPB84DRAFT_546328 [Gymnopilus junonius]
MLVDRDPSLPPSPRLSFRMRSSLTPQPQQRPARYISEPPPLNALVSNPTFLHPPPQPAQEPSLAPTLGTLVDSVRATRPSAKPQRSTLLFSSNASTEVPAERALQQLDVYKTPLLPTRLHSFSIPASIAASTTPDLFKSRRSSKLILMQDDRERVAARSSGKSPLVNETKPYAGEGGMKKLLARRKLEEEEEEGKETKIVQTDEPAPPPRRPSPSPSAPPPVPPPPPPSDWFSTATSASSASGRHSALGVQKHPAITSSVHLKPDSLLSMMKMPMMAWMRMKTARRNAKC